jgi:hypothetical protein
MRSKMLARNSFGEDRGEHSGDAMSMGFPDGRRYGAVCVRPFRNQRLEVGGPDFLEFEPNLELAHFSGRPAASRMNSSGLDRVRPIEDDVESRRGGLIRLKHEERLSVRRDVVV